MEYIDALVQSVQDVAATQGIRAPADSSSSPVSSSSLRSLGRGVFWTLLAGATVYYPIGKIRYYESIREASGKWLAEQRKLRPTVDEATLRREMPAELREGLRESVMRGQLGRISDLRSAAWNMLSEQFAGGRSSGGQVGRGGVGELRERVAALVRLPYEAARLVMLFYVTLPYLLRKPDVVGSPLRRLEQERTAQLAQLTAAEASYEQRTDVRRARRDLAAAEAAFEAASARRRAGFRRVVLLCALLRQLATSSRAQLGQHVFLTLLREFVATTVRVLRAVPALALATARAAMRLPERVRSMVLATLEAYQRMMDTFYAAVHSNPHQAKFVAAEVVENNPALAFESIPPVKIDEVEDFIRKAEEFSPVPWDLEETGRVKYNWFQPIMSWREANLVLGWIPASPLHRDPVDEEFQRETLWDHYFEVIRYGDRYKLPPLILWKLGQAQNILISGPVLQIPEEYHSAFERFRSERLFRGLLQESRYQRSKNAYHIPSFWFPPGVRFSRRTPIPTRLGYKGYRDPRVELKPFRKRRWRVRRSGPPRHELNPWMYHPINDYEGEAENRAMDRERVSSLAEREGVNYLMARMLDQNRMYSEIMRAWVGHVSPYRDWWPEYRTRYSNLTLFDRLKAGDPEDQALVEEWEQFGALVSELVPKDMGLHSHRYWMYDRDVQTRFEVAWKRIKAVKGRKLTKRRQLAVEAMAEIVSGPVMGVRNPIAAIYYQYQFTWRHIIQYENDRYREFYEPKMKLTHPKWGNHFYRWWLMPYRAYRNFAGLPSEHQYKPQFSTMAHRYHAFIKYRGAVEADQFGRYLIARNRVVH